MKNFLVALTVTFIGTLGAFAFWVNTHFLSFLNKDYPAYLSKAQLIGSYSRPGLVILGDSILRTAVLNTRLNPDALNLAIGGASPIENYFVVRHLLQRPCRPKAVLMSINPYHLYRVENFWDIAAKFHQLSGSEIYEVVGTALVHHLTFLDGHGFWFVDDLVEGTLYSVGFPVFYVSSILNAHFNDRLDSNEHILRSMIDKNGEYVSKMIPGSKLLNYSADLDEFKIDPLLDLYFRKTVKLLEDEKIPVYFVLSPINESSVERMEKNGSMGVYRTYLEDYAKQDPNFHLLTDMKMIYSWTLFNDASHFNPLGAELYPRALALSLDKAKVPGGPYCRSRN